MMHYQQQIQKIDAFPAACTQTLLTASECEILAHLYLQPDKKHPRFAQPEQRYEKEAVSRCLKSLYEKNCICKKRQATDERSYQLFMTETGLAELKKGYESILQPFYDLWRSSGKDFEAFMYYADRLAAHIEKGQD